MNRTQLFKRLSGLIFLIFILNFLANTFYWYLSIWWSDMAMHFLGGFWLGLAFLWIMSFNSAPLAPNPSRCLKVILGVLFIGILWEVFEFYFINHVALNPFNILDTASDLFFDLSGGVVALIYFLKKITINTGNEVK